ncbi:hypothetical protein VP1G_02340 [Cytospora mali]|uniref:DUF7708 domain-containing protein n=1 Tax=Cytospora mali TaxID=578113 RepID=A0A194UTJ0_CYTMA|nr:hypothetical protein VP1G_02340 [Valsa mali var. pyri (nom. inval.)]
MASDSPEIKITESMQAFSVMVEEAGTSSDTAQALVDHVKVKLEEERRAEEDKERWRRWWQQSTFIKLETNDDDEMLRVCKELTDIWRIFNKKLGMKRILQKAGLKDIDESHPPTIHILEKAIRSLEKTREDSAGTIWGRTKTNMLAFANTMNGHKQLFSLFPSENIYTSVLSGATCVNHKKVAEGFSKAFRHIGDNMEYLSRSKSSLNTSQARRAVANAYVEVFKFLCYSMNWQASRWNRFSSAVQNTFYDDHIKTHVDEIERLAKLIDRETNRQTHEGVLDLLEIGNTLSSSAQQRSTADRFRTQSESQVSMSFEDASKAFSRLGYDVTHCLTAAEQQHDYDVLMVAFRRAGSAEPSNKTYEESNEQRVDNLSLATDETDTGHISNEYGDALSTQTMPYPVTNYYARQDLERFAQSLIPFVNNGVEEATRFARPDPGSGLPSEVLFDIQTWIRNDASSFLWVEGSVFPADLSPAALRVCAVMADARIPIICFFNQLRYPNPNNLEAKEAGIVCLLYTLIHQLINQLPSVIETEEVMDNTYFDRLDGSCASCEFALYVIRRLLRYAPSRLVIVIHGLEALDTRLTATILGQLVDIIREQSAETVVKAFFSTNGMSRVLGSKINIMERVDASRMGLDRPGRPLRGASSFKDIGMGGSGWGGRY